MANFFVYGGALAYAHAKAGLPRKRLETFPSYIPSDIDIVADWHLTSKDRQQLRDWCRQVGIPAGLPLDVHISHEKVVPLGTPFMDECHHHPFGQSHFVPVWNQSPTEQLSTLLRSGRPWINRSFYLGCPTLKHTTYQGSWHVSALLAETSHSLIGAVKFLRRHRPNFYMSLFDVVACWEQNPNYWPWKRNQLVNIELDCFVIKDSSYKVVDTVSFKQFIADFKDKNR